MTLLWMLLAVGVCAVLWWVAYHIEPHHVARDGSRFLSSGQRISTDGDIDGRRREVWVKLLPEGQVDVEVKRHLRREVTRWSIEGKAEAPPARRAVYVLRGFDKQGGTQRMTIKVPAKSRAVALMDEAIAWNRSR